MHDDFHGGNIQPFQCLDDFQALLAAGEVNHVGEAVVGMGAASGVTVGLDPAVKVIFISS